MGMNNGFLGTNYDNFAGAVILDAVAESPTAAALAAARAPEPASGALIATVMAALAAARRRMGARGVTTGRILGRRFRPAPAAPCR
jgi:hypothetical protein